MRFHMMELLMILMVTMSKQAKIVRQLKQEQSGLIKAELRILRRPACKYIAKYIFIYLLNKRFSYEIDYQA